MGKKSIRIGWIYLRRMRGNAFCIGKTIDPNRRAAEYKKENPFLEDVDGFFAMNVDDVEEELIRMTAAFRLPDKKTKEWLRDEPAVQQVFVALKKKYGLMTAGEWEKSEFLARSQPLGSGAESSRVSRNQMTGRNKKSGVFSCRQTRGCTGEMPVSNRALCRCPKCGLWNAVP